MVLRGDTTDFLERAARTQPVPLRPAPFARQRLTADLLTQRTPEAPPPTVVQH